MTECVVLITHQEIFGDDEVLKFKHCPVVLEGHFIIVRHNMVPLFLEDHAVFSYCRLKCTLFLIYCCSSSSSSNSNSKSNSSSYNSTVGVMLVS